MTAQNRNVTFEELAAKSRVFADLMRIYLRCSNEIQEVVVNMVRLIDDPEASEEDRERACGTIAGALLAFTGDTSRLSSNPRDREFCLQIPVETKAMIQEHQRAFAERLRTLRMRKGWTQQELAQRGGIGQSAISMMENGQCRPQLGTLLKLADALGVARQELWSGTEPLRNGLPKQQTSAGIDQGRQGKPNATY